MGHAKAWSCWNGPRLIRLEILFEIDVPFCKVTDEDAT